MQVPPPHGSCLEALVQPCVPPLKREAGKSEGVCEEQSGGESQRKDEGTQDGNHWGGVIQFRRERRLRAIHPVLPVRRAALSHCKRGLAQIPRHFCLKGRKSLSRGTPRQGREPRASFFHTTGLMFGVRAVGSADPGLLPTWESRSCRIGHEQNSDANPGGRDGRKEGRAAARLALPHRS